MYIHKEGRKIALITIAIVLAVSAIILIFSVGWLRWAFESLVILIGFFIVRFFRIPNRELLNNPNKIVSSADGTIVVVEKVFEDEYLKTECLQVSTFMSPNNVHVNRYPISGKIVYTQYHDGKYFYAHHPKSSMLNERNTVCIEREDGKRVLIRQVAGALARRIVCYAKVGEQVEQSTELGFIKFGSRVDLFIPLDSEVHVEIEDKVKGGVSVIATI